MVSIFQVAIVCVFLLCVSSFQVEDGSLFSVARDRGIEQPAVPEASSQASVQNSTDASQKPPRFLQTLLSSLNLNICISLAIIVLFTIYFKSRQVKVVPPTVLDPMQCFYHIFKICKLLRQWGERGAYSEGIFRESGNTRIVEQIVNNVMTEADFQIPEGTRDIELAVVLKRLLAAYPGGIITSWFLQVLLDAEARDVELGPLFGAWNQQAFDQVMGLFAWLVVHHLDQTKMTALALGIASAPSFTAGDSVALFAKQFPEAKKQAGDRQAQGLTELELLIRFIERSINKKVAKLLEKSGKAAELLEELDPMQGGELLAQMAFENGARILKDKVHEDIATRLAGQSRENWSGTLEASIDEKGKKFLSQIGEEKKKRIIELMVKVQEAKVGEIVTQAVFGNLEGDLVDLRRKVRDNNDVGQNLRERVVGLEQKLQKFDELERISLVRVDGLERAVRERIEEFEKRLRDMEAVQTMTRQRAAGESPSEITATPKQRRPSMLSRTPR